MTRCSLSLTSPTTSISSLSSRLEEPSSTLSGSDERVSGSRAVLDLAARVFESTILFSNFSASFICEPYKLSFRCDSAAEKPNPQGAYACPSSLEKSNKCDRSVYIVNFSQCTHTKPSSTKQTCSSPRHIMHNSCVSSDVKNLGHRGTNFLKCSPGFTAIIHTA